MYIYVCIYVCIYICIFVCIFAYLCTHTHIYCIGAASTAYDEDTVFATPAHSTALHTSTLPSLLASPAQRAAHPPPFFLGYTYMYIYVNMYIYIYQRGKETAHIIVQGSYTKMHNHI